MNLEARRELLEKYKPGKVTDELREALLWRTAVVAESTGQEPDWPWFAQMAFWGYPPGSLNFLCDEIIPGLWVSDLMVISPPCACAQNRLDGFARLW
jgi:hypothetical protein